MLYDRLNCNYKNKLEMVDDIYPSTYRSMMRSLKKDSFSELTISEAQDLCQFILEENITIDNLFKLFSNDSNN